MVLLVEGEMGKMKLEKVKPDFFHRRANVEFWRGDEVKIVVGVVHALSELFEEMDEE